MQNITTKNAAKYKYATVQNTNFQLCKIQIFNCANYKYASVQLCKYHD